MGKRTGTYSRIFLHFVWRTKNSAPLIEGDIKRAVVGVFARKAREIGVEIIEANGPKDHMHILLKSRPAIAPSEIAKELKGASSHLVNHVILNDDPTKSFYWQDGFGVESVSPSSLSFLRN